ncbi:MAG: MFS transporter [Planctomycetes bacterium]|nr:MFS transporter [Planctomycetota bacterium]
MTQTARIPLPAAASGGDVATVPDRPTPLALGLLAVGMLIPVTLPVPVLRGLVHERFGVSELWVAAFMSVNMVGALLAAPLAGAWADRTGRRRGPIAAALAVDAALFVALAQPLPFWLFMLLRFVEGAAHITALSLLLSLAGDRARLCGSGRVMGFVGAGLTLGVAMGAPIGGVLGNVDPLRPLWLGAGISAALAIACRFALGELPRTTGRPTLREIVAAVRRDRALLVPLAYAFVDRFTVGFFTTQFTLWMKGVHGLEPARVGMLLGLFLGPLSLLSYPFGRLAERGSRVALVAGGSVVYGVGLLTLGAWPLDALPIVMVGLGVASAVMFVPSLMLTTDLAAPAVRGTALGGFNGAGSLGFLLGPLVGGAVSHLVAHRHGAALGYPAAFAVAGLAELACVALTLRALRRLACAGRTA